MRPRHPRRRGAVVTPWTTVRIYTPGSRRPTTRLTPEARAGLLRSWAEGSRVYVTRVTGADGDELDPRDVDWTGLEPPPARRPGRPQTARGRGGAQVLLRLTADERDALQRAADAAGEPLAAWARGQLLRLAR